MEVWRDILGFEGFYQVSDIGNVRSLNRQVKNSRSGEYFIKKGRLMKLSNSSSHGYLTVSLNREGLRKVKTVHSLVVESFLGMKPVYKKEVIDHINDVKTDNRLKNLQVISYRENYNRSNKNKGTSKFSGVCWDNANGKWKAYAFHNGKLKHLGYFTDEILASNTYNKYLNSL